MKLIARWTIGPVSISGQKILRESINRFSVLYPEFKRIICFNHIDIDEIKDLSKLAFLYKQSQETVPCVLSNPDNNPIEATGCGWKLAPPRLDINSMELFIDNDIIIHKRLPQIDEWLENKNCGLIAEGLHRKRMYGVFDCFVPERVHANAGLFGLPAGFDFEEKIIEYSKFLDGSLGGYNEQGLTVATITNMKEYIMVPLSRLHIAEGHVDLPEQMPDAIHFVHVNRSEWHRGWQSYQARTKKISLL